MSPHNFVVLNGDATEMFADCQSHTVKTAENRKELAPRSSLVYKWALLNGASYTGYRANTVHYIGNERQMMNDDDVLLFIQTTYSTNDYIVDDDDCRTREYDDDYNKTIF